MVYCKKIYERGSYKRVLQAFKQFLCNQNLKKKTPKISIFCMFSQASQIASDMLYNQSLKHF